MMMREAGTRLRGLVGSALALWLFGAACAAERSATRTGAGDGGGGSSRGGEATTYAGEIPCADCEGQRVVVTLFPEGTFRMRHTYRGVEGGGNKEFHDLGTWSRSGEGGDRLSLTSGRESGWRFRAIGKDRLRMLDRAGNEIESKLNYDLAKERALDPIAGPMRLSGMYSGEARGGTFTECFTGTVYGLTKGAGRAGLESAYLGRNFPTEEPALATIDGRFVSHPDGPDGGPREELVVDRFERLFPDETCGSQSR